MTSIQPESRVDRAAAAVALWVGRAVSAAQRVHPKAADAATGRTLLVADDPDAVFGRTVTAGATPTAQSADEYGWHVARITDPFGHHWEIGHSLAAWPRCAKRR